MKKLNKKVLVAMSGGVDSSVAAALLKKNGYEVAGVFLRLADKRGLNAELRGKIKTDEESAREVAEKLKIPFKVADARIDFKKTVADYFLREYKNGRTPNPCVVCNPKIKFAEIIKIADKLKFDYVATGHYARVIKHKAWNMEQNVNRLFKALDETKDQSYFLYGLSQEQLSRVIFPLGEYRKTEVRKLAKTMKLPVFNRQESRDVCFISDKTEEYLRKNLNLKKGKIVDAIGKILGEHRGLPLYTIGQRKGINIGGTGPYFVIAKNCKNNELLVANDIKEKYLFSKKAVLENVRWAAKEPKSPVEVLARTRYRNPLVYATIKTQNNADEKYTADKTRKEYVVEFEKAQRAVAPGQSVVFYTKKGEVLGGGIIK